MKLNFIEDETKSLVVEFEGVDRGIPDLIREKLMESKDVEFAGVVKDHPEALGTKLIVKSEKNARALVLKALEALEEDFKTLASQVPKA